MPRVADKLKQKHKHLTHIVCYSGGLSSAKVAMNVKWAYPHDTVILLNHDINANVEHQDIKRFKEEVAEALDLEVTYANIEGLMAEDIPDQFEVTETGFKFGSGSELCTFRLKTEPFNKYLKSNFPVESGKREDVVIYYGFDINEKVRIQRRSTILGQQGYYTDYPLATWENVNHYIVEDYGIEPPLTYSTWKHANCIGCLKAGKQHWYSVFCLRPDIWEKAKDAENNVGYSIIQSEFLEELEPYFIEMKNKGIIPTESIDGRKFWASVRRVVPRLKPDSSNKPCECVI